MRRREFIKIFAGAAGAWPRDARAQQSAIPVIGFLSSASPKAYAGRVAAFRKGLNESGYIDSQCRDRPLICHFEMAGRDQRVRERRQLVLGDVGGQHARPLGGKSKCRCAADPLRRRGHQGAFTCEPSRHRAKLPRAAPHCKLTKLAVRESGPGSGVNCGGVHPPIPKLPEGNDP
jgi:hypothetical protein